MPAELQVLFAAPWLPRMAATIAVALYVIQCRAGFAPAARGLFKRGRSVLAWLRSRMPAAPNLSDLQPSYAVLALAALSLGSAVYQGGWSLPGIVTTKATAATYIHEKDDSAIPSAVKAGLNRLNRERKIVATIFEDDGADGAGDVPQQYAAPLAAAREAGLPALVVTAGETVLKVVKSPTTAAQVMEAVP